MAPASVTEENEEEAWKNLYRNQNKTFSKPRFQIGDTVRISREKLIFEKGYEQNWTREIFTVYHILRREPTVYKVKDFTGEVIRGTFYEQELQKVTDSGYYPIEKILKTRKKNGKFEYFVQFLGYTEKFNMWGEWEMGLVDFIYPHTWYNIREGNNLFGFDLGDGKLIARKIPQGCYESIPDILEGMYSEDFKNKKEFYYHPVVKRVNIKTKGHIKIFLAAGAKYVEKEVLRTGAQIANDLLEGRNLQESAEERAKETGRILAKKAIKKADDMLGVYVDGHPMPHQPIELDFEKDNYIRAYQNLFLQSEGLYLSRTEFPKGYALYLFDLSPDLCDGEHFNLIKHSNLRIELKFNIYIKL
ncbi:uncharacterized transposon-derived protein F54H12.3 [Trichonephila clavipes]|nr:uncharacterized transposon-derived protein F54H12.3 [Trichonephila clavipes]